MADPNYTLIAIILDRSGSMKGLEESTVAGLNQFLRAQRELPGRVTLHFIQFNDWYEVHQDWSNLKEVRDMNVWDFRPQGGTALLDAVGRTIDEVGSRLADTPENLRPGKVVVVIQTDGFENASRAFTYERIKQMITHQQEKYSWEFIFLGANQDAILSGEGLGISKGKSLSYNANPTSTAKMFWAASNSVANYRLNLDSNVTEEIRTYVSDDTIPVAPI